MFHMIVFNAGKAVKKVLGGRTYYVAPLTMIVPGVLNGSKGPLYYPPEEIEKSVQDWNHIPIVLDHPVDNGQPVSARNPHILQKFGLGYVFHARFDGKLVAQGWFDEEATGRVAPDVLKALKAGKPIELSTGLFTRNEQKTGTFNGKRYKGIARDYKPDHLAILTDRPGACSIKDGCGVLVNMSSEKACKMLKDGTVRGRKLTNKQRKLFAARCKKRTDNALKRFQKQIEEDASLAFNCLGDMSYDEFRSQLTNAFHKAHPVVRDARGEAVGNYKYIVDIFDGHFVYRDGDQLMRQNYAVDTENGEVSLEDDPEPVRRVVKYVANEASEDDLDEELTGLDEEELEDEDMDDFDEEDDFDAEYEDDFDAEDEDDDWDEYVDDEEDDDLAGNAGSSDNPLDEEESDMTKLTANQRKSLIGTLAANCEGLKALGEDVLNKLSDAKLLDMKNNMGGKKGKKKKEEDEDEEVENAELEEELELEDEKQEETPAPQSKKPTDNSEMSEEEWLRKAPPRVQKMIANYERREKARRKQLITVLTENAERRGLKLNSKYFDKKSVEELEALVQLAGINNRRDVVEEEEDEPMFLGAGTLSSNAEGGDDDILPLPTTNWDNEEDDEEAA